MELLFKRLREVNITCNPKKCRFGLEEIEYVGHTLTKDGWSFARSKIDRVLEWPEPKTKGDLKKFIGLVNYFHSHVVNMSDHVHLLEGILHENTQYNRRHRNDGLQWNDKSRKIFHDVKEAIDKLPMLYFLDTEAPIYLETDASDYGIGGVLYQVIEGQTKIIELFSKSLCGPLRNWSTPDKEAYAIYYAFAKYEYLLHSSKFILRTDHKNLTYLNFEGSKKIRRWRALISDYNFTIEHIKGDDNIVADQMSRCCQDVNDIISADLTSNSTPNNEELDNRDSFIMSLDSMEELTTYFDGHDELLVLDEEDISIPQDKYDHIESVHNALVGHNGVNRTMYKLYRKGVHFPKMRLWVRQFIRMCPFCQKMEYKRLKANVVPFTLSTYEAMLKLSLDSIGPLPEDSRGNKYILVIIDTFTRWTMCYPLQSLNAIDCVRTLIQHIGIFGAPSEFVTDNGSQFDNSLFNEIISMLRDKYKIVVKHSLSVAYSRQEQGIVERANNEVLLGMKAIVYEENTITSYFWSDYILFIQRILYTGVNSKYPSQLVTQRYIQSTLWAPSQLATQRYIQSIVGSITVGNTDIHSKYIIGSITVDIASVLLSIWIVVF